MPQFGEKGGDSKTEKIKFLVVECVSVEFKSDHNLIRDNKADFQKSGSRYPKPEWTSDKRNERVPITHSKEKTVELEAEFIATTDSSKTGKLSGEIPTNFVLESSGSTTLAPDTKVKVKFKSKRPLPNVIRKLRKEFQWDAQVDGEMTLVTPSGEHVLYITWGDPIDEGLTEDGVTHRRMEKAIKWVGEAWEGNKRRPVEVVDELFGKFKHYRLGFDYLPPNQRDFLKKNPKILSEMSSAGFAKYRNAGAGGAWPLSHYWRFGGECQAIVRLIRAIIHQVGMPGKAEVKYVNANASDPYTAIIKGEGSRCAGPKPGHAYALVDSPVSAGKSYFDDATIGWNNYEAYLKFTHDKEYWYGGGIGRLPEGYDPLKVFYGLVEFTAEKVGAKQQLLRHVTRVWKYKH